MSFQMSIIPFQHKHQLNHELDDDANPKPSLPGQPRINLSDRVQVSSFIRKEFDLGDLETLAPRLWLMSKQDSASISPLHRQAVIGRKIIITEDMRLHLLWHYDRIFIKPLPRYITSHVFWSQYLDPKSTRIIYLPSEKEAIRRTALGYLRTYTNLVVHESDFHIAQEHRLIPKNITWTQLNNFLAPLEKIHDTSVSGRFQYGEIRLTRLNFYSKVFLRKIHFYRMYNQYGAYFATFYAPLLYTFGTLSLLLSAMQVGMSVEQVYFERQWVKYWDVCRGFSLSCLVVGVCSGLTLAGLFIYKLLTELVYAIKHRMSKKRNIRSLA